MLIFPTTFNWLYSIATMMSMVNLSFFNVQNDHTNIILYSLLARLQSSLSETFPQMDSQTDSWKQQHQ